MTTTGGLLPGPPLKCIPVKELDRLRKIEEKARAWLHEWTENRGNWIGSHNRQTPAEKEARESLREALGVKA